MTRKRSDVDIDLPDRDSILKHIAHTPAAMWRTNPPRRHASGVYVTPVPYDPFYDMCAIDYTEAEARGYFKLDLLNLHLYSQVRNEEHLVQLMKSPQWSLLENRDFVERLIHISAHWDALARMPQPITSIDHLAMFLAIIRPAKRHLIGLPWSEVAPTIWLKPDDGSYIFKKSHSYAYAYLVVVNMNLLVEQSLQASDQSD